ncbi:MAG: ABC transporter ATP-binding protein [Pseudomonadota bacterium]
MTSARATLRIEGASVGAADADRSFELVIDKLEVASGDVIGISGPSGTGKTMLLELLGLLRRPSTAGLFSLSAHGCEADVRAMWEGPSAAAMAPALRGDFYGFVPQSGGLLPFLTVAENIRLSQRIAGRIDPVWQAELEGFLGLDRLNALRPASLSIGQRQRVAICRALAHKPPFVIADEPTAALDPENAANAMALLIETARAGQAAVVISSHDLGLLDRFAMRRLQLDLLPSEDTRRVRSGVFEAAEAMA